MWQQKIAQRKVEVCRFGQDAWDVSTPGSTLMHPLNKTSQRKLLRWHRQERAFAESERAAAYLVTIDAVQKHSAVQLLDNARVLTQDLAHVRHSRRHPADVLHSHACKHAAEPEELGEQGQARLCCRSGSMSVGYDHGISCTGLGLQHVAPVLPAGVHFTGTHSAGMAPCCTFCMLHILDHAHVRAVGRAHQRIQKSATPSACA